MSKKKKPVRPDDYFSNGLFEIARFGKVVSMKNLMDEQTASAYHAEIADGIGELTTQIDGLVERIRTHVSKCNPLNLMNYLVSMRNMATMNIFSESNYTRDDIAMMRSVEYIQSILVSEEVYDPGESVDGSKVYSEILSLVEELYRKIPYFIIAWGTGIKLENDEDLEYVIEAQLLYIVRGERYQFLQLPFYEEILSPLDNYFKEIYEISAIDVIEGLRKLEVALSSGRLDAMENIRKLFERFQNLPDEESAEKFIELHAEEHYQAINEALGTALFDVQSVTGWPNSFINDFTLGINEDREFFFHEQYKGWPIWNLPVQKKPFIRINGKVFCFDYYLLFDHFYRCVQRAIRAKGNPYFDGWGKIQQESSERLVEKLFKKLLPGCKSYRGNYYQKDYENDLLITYRDVLFIIEVKAGAFTYTPALTDIDAHRKSFEALVNKAGNQCKRTEEYLYNNIPAAIYDHSQQIKTTVDIREFSQVYSFCVTIDDFNAFAARAEKVAFVKIKTGTISISVNDLWVYTEYFHNPIEFIHFLKQRKEATKTKGLALNDELDHLGLYIEKNVYSIHPNEMSDEFNVIHYQGYREDLDKYFSSLYNPELNFPRPAQNFLKLYKELLELADREANIKTEITNFLLDFSDSGRENFCKSIEMLLSRTKFLRREISGISVSEECCYCAFVRIPGIEICSECYKKNYARGLMVYHNAPNCYLMTFVFSQDEKLESIHYEKFFLADVAEDEIPALYDEGKKGVQNRIETFKAHSPKHKIYPNDKCPCGSGKKYKRCCGK